MSRPSSPFQEILGHIGNYFGASMAQRAIALVSIPVYTRLLTTQEYGIVAVLLSYTQVCATIFTLNTHVAIGRYFYEEKRDFSRFLGTSLLLSSALLCASLVILTSFRERIARWTALPDNVIPYLFPLTIVAVISAVYTQVFAPQKESGLLARTSILQTYAVFICSVAVILLLETDRHFGRIWDQLAAGSFFALYMSARIRPYAALGLEKSHLSYIASYCLPLIPYNLSGIILAQFDLMFINSRLGSATAGVYGLAYGIGMLMEALVQAINSGWMPDYVKYMNTKDYESHDKDIDRLFRLTIAGAVAIVLFGRTAGVLLAHPRYHDGLSIIPAVTAGYVFYAVFYIYGKNMGYSKRTAYASLVTLLSGAANIALNALFIPRFGYTAAAYTTLASYAIMAISAWLINRYVIRLHATPLTLLLGPALVLFASMALDLGISAYLSPSNGIPARLAVLVLAMALLKPYRVASGVKPI